MGVAKSLSEFSYKVIREINSDHLDDEKVSSSRNQNNSPHPQILTQWASNHHELDQSRRKRLPFSRTNREKSFGWASPTRARD